MTDRFRTVSHVGDGDLVRRALVHAIGTDRTPRPAWANAGAAFALGQTFARQLCRRFGIDPETGDALPPADRAP